MIKPHLQYLLYLLRHKWFVLLEMQKRGLFWRGLVHDLSKFRPDEWNSYAKYFFGNGNRVRFELAEYLHKGRNPHHWEYWEIPLEESRKMDEPSRIEMLCDWLAMERANGKPVREWYEKHKKRIRLHPKDKLWLENEITKLSKKF